ncbi:NAD(P)H-dependent glycerol-3-phosphate dehydrogenase [Oleispirillum naphthae]|uniref:NAD(P)H-dependent glycerol-3-phosphate dehydrogenase n=1 Tax=Oleispirillum naphthae TaxID=2838853 RepID=UPI0030825F4C
MDRIGIVGAGAWGTALANTAAKAGRAATLWAHEADVVEGINAARENGVFLPGVKLDPGVVATGKLAEIAACDVVLWVTPAQFARRVLRDYSRFHRPGVPVVMCAKGIEEDTLCLMSEVLTQELPRSPWGVLSGPTFAAEVARGLPTAITLACADEALARRLAHAVGTPAFRPYWSRDVIAAEVGGAVKNVLAIACGIVSGRGLGHNAQAALITRGLAEITRLAVAKGAQPVSLMGLAGLGDLILTATSMMSRNFSLGAALGQGRALADILAERRAVTEGVATARAVRDLAAKTGIDMPVAAAVAAVLFDGADIAATISDLLARPLRAEQD